MRGVRAGPRSAIMPAMSTPLRSGQILTVFRSRLRSDANPRYAEHVAWLSELARSMPGYVEHKVFTAEDGERVTVVTFDTEANHDAWRRHPDHVAAQRVGSDLYYESYSIQVATVSRVSAHSSSPAGATGSPRSRSSAY